MYDLKYEVRLSINTLPTRPGKLPSHGKLIPFFVLPGAISGPAGDYRAHRVRAEEAAAEARSRAEGLQHPGQNVGITSFSKQVLGLFAFLSRCLFLPAQLCHKKIPESIERRKSLLNPPTGHSLLLAAGDNVTRGPGLYINLSTGNVWNAQSPSKFRLEPSVL